MARFDKQIALAKRLIAKNGESVTLTNTGRSDPTDPAKPWRGAEAVPANQTIEAVFLNYEGKRIDGEVILMGDQEVLMPHEGLTDNPRIGSTITRASGEKWNVVNWMPLNPNGQYIMHTLQVRRP